MKHASLTVSSLLALAVIATGCAPESKPAESGAAETAKTQAAGLPAGAAEAKTAADTKTTLDAKPAAQTTGETSAQVQSKPKTFAARGIYVTATSMALPRFKTMIASLKASGGNTIVFDGKDEGGIVSWPSEVPLVKKIGASKEGPLKDIKEKIKYAHEQGIHVAARVVCFNDPILAKARPDLNPRDVNGGVWKEVGHQVWLDPSKQEAQDYNIALAKELASFGVDEIQWDYVRFPAMGKTQNARYAFDPKTPKHEIITGFVKRAYEELKPTGVLISADVYGIMAWAQDIDVRITGQLLEDMAKHVDVLCPMVYPSHFSDGFAGIARPANSPYLFVHKGVSLLQKKVKGTGVTVRPWLQAMPYKVASFTPHYVYEQLRASEDADAIGWMLWNAQNKYDVGWAGAKAYTKQGK